MLQLRPAALLSLSLHYDKQHCTHCSVPERGWGVGCAGLTQRAAVTNICRILAFSA